MTRDSKTRVKIEYGLAGLIFFVLTALIFPSPAAATCGATWANPPPSYTYKDAPFRIHFLMDDPLSCIDSLMNMDGKTFNVTLIGESESIKVKVKNAVGGAEFYQDIMPVNGWGGRTEINLSLFQLNNGCYPSDVQTFSILDTSAPVATKIKMTMGANSQYLGFEFDPADPQFIYWIKITPIDYKWNDGQIPLMISPKSSSGKGAFTQLAGWGEICVWSLYLNPCVEYSATVIAEDLLGSKSPVSDPITFTLGAGPNGSFWKMGDPMNCSNGCSCSNVGL